MKADNTTLKYILSQDSFAIYCRPFGAMQCCEGGNYTGRVFRSGVFEASLWPGEVHQQIEVCLRSTPREEYINNVNDIVEALKRRGGKTVLSRRICGKFEKLDINTLIHDYFSEFGDMFCFLFRHPATGYWLGASPELLLDCSASQYRTRALAGTRPGEISGDWDDKNIQEHAYVVDDICKRINELDINTYTRPLSELKYGNLTHLCTEIDIHPTDAVDAQTIVNTIHPTPALAGFPREKALEDIRRYEDTPRYFYGGMLVSPGMYYAALRCVNFDNENWCVYTGSGITADSDAQLEWAETEAKASPLIKLLKKL